THQYRRRKSESQAVCRSNYPPRESQLRLGPVHLPVAVVVVLAPEDRAFGIEHFPAVGHAGLESRGPDADEHALLEILPAVDHLVEVGVVLRSEERRVGEEWR